MLTRRQAIALGAASVVAPALGASPPPSRVLFIGNSFLIEHDLPSMFAHIVGQAGHPVALDMIAEGGAYLADVVARESPEEIDARYRPGLVILQDHSTVALYPDRAARSHAAIRQFCQLTARKVLFATWARRAGHKLYRRAGMPETPAGMTGIVAQHYAGAACGDDRTSVAPVGQAWMMGEDLPLHRGDDYHASRAGAWLSAVVLARTAGMAPDRPQAPYGIADPDRLIEIARLAVP